MNPAANNGSPYRVPPEPGRWRSLSLAVGMHVLLLLFLWAGVSWQSTPPVAVEAEVWDMKVQSAAPPPLPAPAPEPEPEEVKPPPKPVEQPPEVEAKPTPPDIALEKARLRAEKLKEEKAKKEAEQKKLEERKLEEEKEKKELAEKQKREKAEKLAKAKAEADARKKLDDMRKEEMRRIMGAAGTSGTAAKSTAPRIDSGYLASITAKIKSSTTYLGSLDVAGNPRAVFKVDQLPTGEILSVRKVKSSGVPGFDDAVEKGIIKSSPLPKKKDGTVERSLEIGFSMKDLD
ncbi:cell envelope integrity protein TolA [Massilia cavernae]|uniref:Cell envelope integrity protein TolA n=2 Tax=Massilia cavernae TaxID=2320864 RepID=A0A418Y5U5_9BURK|nr:cell envelope integrity protein TolA [Massilia cavernae]